MQWAIFTAIILFAIVVGFWFLGQIGPANPVPIKTDGEANEFNPSLSTSWGLGLKYNEQKYAIARTPSEVDVEAFIPPCDESMDYCIYRSSDEFADTNFESAGLRLKKRDDLSGESACLNTSPGGYVDLVPNTRRDSAGYATSVFSNLSNAATGHQSMSSVYRLYQGGQCFEFEARIGTTAFLNYPVGSIEEFTDEHFAVVYAELIDILNTTTILSTGTTIRWPAVD